MKILILFFIFLSSLSAFSKVDVISDVYVSFDSEKFINIKNFEVDNNIEKLDFKILFNKKALAESTYFLRLNHNYKNIKDVSVEAFRDDNELIIELNKDTPSEIIIKTDSSTSTSSLFIDIELFTKNEFKEILDAERLLFGLAYGIIFCAFLYNLVLFIFNHEKTFLYYSLLQISLLLLLITEVMTLDVFKPLYKYFFLPDMMGHLSLIFAILFNRAFLNSKNKIPKIDKLLLIFLILHLLDLLCIIFMNKSYLYEYIPNSLVLSLLLLSSFLVYKQGYKIAIFYILGWSILFIVVFLAEYEFLDFADIYALHFAIPLESLILSFTLGYKMKQLERKNMMQEQMLIHQNKLASMGEMINNISHQYRQPLTHLGYILMNINSAYEHDELNKNYLDKKMKQANQQLEFMSETIDNFRDFYKPKKDKEIFYIHSAIKSAVDIITPIFESNKINLTLNVDKNVQILGFENEYSQILLNLLTNAKDALIQNSIENPKIEIELKEENDKTLLFVSDNALGVEQGLEEKIFEPYFTTKEKSSGIGLYMSTVIIQEHFNGTLYLNNNPNGAEFIIQT